MRALALALLGLVMLGSVNAYADDLDEWCAQATKASSIVICSDNQLRQGALTRNKLFDIARQKLDPEAYKVLTDDQQRWIRNYTAKCGVPLDGPPPSIPVPRAVVECYRRESEDRTAHLYARLIGVLPPGSSREVGPPTSNSNPVGNPPAQTPSQQAMGEWYDCLYTAVDALADQPESAKTVAEAAFGGCAKYENAYIDLSGGWSVRGAVEQAKVEIMAPRVLSRVMIDRAARAKLQKEPPTRVTVPELNYHQM